MALNTNILLQKKRYIYLKISTKPNETIKKDVIETLKRRCDVTVLSLLWKESHLMNTDMFLGEEDGESSEDEREENGEVKICVCERECVCVCVRERERERVCVRERERRTGRCVCGERGGVCV